MKNLKRFFLLMALATIGWSNSVNAQIHFSASSYMVPLAISNGLGSTTLTWTVTGAAYTQVWVSAGTGARTLMASANASGSSTPPWIQQGLYTFYLYTASGWAGNDTTALVGWIDVYGVSPEIDASQYAVPVSKSTGLGTTTLNWSALGASYTQVWVSTGGARTQMASSFGASGTTTAPWIQNNGTTYTFWLYNASGYAANDTISVVSSCNVVGTPALQPQIGMNKMDLLMQYYGDGSGCSGGSTTCGSVAKRLAKKAITDAKYIGAGYLRVAVSDFYGTAWQTDSVNFWNAMDTMVSNLNAAGVKLVPSLMFNELQFAQAYGTDIHSFITNPNSTAYVNFTKFMTKFINRYKSNGVIYFYELHNELNLLADIKDSSNSSYNILSSNFSSPDMYAYFQRVSAFIRGLDPNHQITTGNGFPRTSAEHLIIQPDWIGADWTLDSYQQYKQYINDSHKYIDIECVHAYNSGDQLRFGLTGTNNAALIGLTKQISDSAGKLLYVGELGDVNPNSLYNTTCQFTQNVFDTMRVRNIAFCSPWILDFLQFDTYHENLFNIDNTYNTGLISKLISVNQALGNPALPSTHPDNIKPVAIIGYPFTGYTFNRPTDTIYASVTDNSLKINRVELWIDGSKTTTSTTWPYKLALTTTLLVMGNHQVVIHAFDSTGNMGADTITMYKNQNGRYASPDGRIESDIVNIYPNPSTGKFTIIGSNIKSITVYNLLGELVYQSIGQPMNQSTIDLSGNRAGTYFLKVTTDEGVVVKKIVKQE